MIGMLVVLLCTLFMMTGCPTGQEPQKQQEDVEIWLYYSFPECEYLNTGYLYQDGSYAVDFFGSTKFGIESLISKRVRKGEKIKLLDNGGGSTLEVRGYGYGSGYYTAEYKKEFIFAKNGKGIIGWSKKKDGSTKDYDFGQEITVTANEDVTLYPAYTKYGIGDSIDGKTVVYIRRDYVTKENSYSVEGTDWRYIAVDVAAGKNSEGRNWWYNSAKNIITSDNIGTGKENTKAIIDPSINVANDNTAGNNAFYYCSIISPNGYVPSKGEMQWVANAIQYRKLEGFSVYGSETKKFWTSSQKDTVNAWYIEIKNQSYSSVGYLKDNGTKAGMSLPIIPIVYYDDDGKVVK